MRIAVDSCNASLGRIVKFTMRHPVQLSLRSAALIPLWVSTILWVWTGREPWVQAHKSILSAKDANALFKSWPIESPDGTRWVQTRVDTPPMNYLPIIELPSCNQIGDIKVDVAPSMGPVPLAFETNDKLLIATSLYDLENGPVTVLTYSRRFPEWWWGHLYRPEVWLLLALSSFFVWSIRRDYA